MFPASLMSLPMALPLRPSRSSTRRISGVKRMKMTMMMVPDWRMESKSQLRVYMLKSWVATEATINRPTPLMTSYARVSLVQTMSL